MDGIQAATVAVRVGVYLLAGVAVSGVMIRAFGLNRKDDGSPDDQVFRLFRGFVAVFWPGAAMMLALFAVFYVAGRLSEWFFSTGPEE